MALDETPLPPGMLHRQTIPITIDYPVLFERNCLAPGSRALAWALGRNLPFGRARVFVVVDRGLALARPQLIGQIASYFDEHGELLELRGEIVLVPGGESAKSDPHLVARLHDEMLERHLDRHSFTLIFGGGAVLDAVGFAAATFHRGLRVVRVPTTVLAQNDAGVGVKNGVNARGIKNLVGTFQAPHAVVNDAELLTSLDARDVRSGLAEAVKVALIRDADFYEWLLASVDRLAARDDSALEESVRRAALLHLNHITRGGDPFETGSARPLDFGHWSAHKLESLSGHTLKHGEAVAIGMAIDVLYAARRGLLQRATAEGICTLLEDLGFRLDHELLNQRANGRLEILDGLEEFREHIGGALLITLVTEPGRSVEVTEIDQDVVEQAVLELLARKEEKR